MTISTPRRRLVLGGFWATAVGAVAVGILGVFAGAGGAASTARPRPIVRPSISGTPQEGHRLYGHRGRWSGRPTDYNDFWDRCNTHGRNCSHIGGANGRTYRLTSADVGNRIRFTVEAR